MAVVVKAVAVIAKAVFAKATVAAVAKFAVTTALSIGVSKLIAKRASEKVQASAGGDGGGRIQLPPATDNKLPVIYGKAWTGGPIIDAVLSTDQKTMWYVVALAEAFTTSTLSRYNFDTTNGVYYDGKKVQFASSTSSVVTGLITNDAAAQVDTRVNGFLDIYLFRNGRASGVNTGGLTADQIISVANGAPAAQAWTVNHLMSNCAFAIIKVVYSQDAGTTGVGTLMCTLDNGYNNAAGYHNPGLAILDYMTNTRYGCAIPSSRIDTTSLNNLNTYSAQLIDYKPVGWVSGDPYSTIRRYSINGPIDTANDCLTNLQYLLDACDSWLQYSELTGRWRVVMNKGYDQAPGATTLSNLFLVNSSNLVGGIEISPLDLNETYNQVEVAYPNTNIRDQTDYQVINLFDTNPVVISPNEAVNRLNITLPVVNNAVQAKYISARRILQSREDLVVSFRTDYSGIQVEAGDVIRITHETYGWTDKLFRVSEVAEEKDDQGNLFAAIRAFEYNGTVYADDPVQDFVPSANTGLKDPNVISPPGDPVITNSVNTDGLITSFDVTSYVPDSGLVLYMDFNYGTNSNVLTHQLYRTVQQSNGVPFINSDSANAVYNNVSVNVNDLKSGNYYWSVTARNNTAGRRSGSSAVVNWGGANVTPYDPNTNTGGIIGNQIQNNTVTYTNLGAGGTKPISVVAFGIPDVGGNTVTLPVAIDPNVITSAPVYVDGANVDPNYYYPYYQNTSTTANGYVDNSTNVWEPAGASFQVINNGDDNWYGFIYDNFGNTTNFPLASNESLKVNLQATWIANQDCDLQIASFYTANNTPGTIYVDNQGVSTYQLKANIPYQIITILGYSETANNPIDGSGYLVKNLSNTDVRAYTVYCRLDLSKEKIT